MTQTMDPPAAAPAENGKQLARVEAVERPLAKANPPVSQRGGIEIRSFDDAWRMAVAISRSGLAPKGVETPEALFVAIEMGMEVGLAPMAACRSIAVINGRPAIYGDAALALVRASGLLESFEERIEGEGDNRRAVCISNRKGMPKARTTTFSVADARKAGIWGKSGPWTQYPERMLQFRARGFCLRDEFGDVLQGMHTFEEVADIGPMPVVTDAPQRGVAGLLSRVKQPPLDTGQTFDPSTASEDPVAAIPSQPDAQSHDVQEPDVSHDTPDQPADPEREAFQQWWAGAEELAQEKGLAPEQFRQGMTHTYIAHKVKGQEWKLPIKARQDVIKCITERRGHFA